MRRLESAVQSIQSVYSLEQGRGTQNARQETELKTELGAVSQSTGKQRISRNMVTKNNSKLGQAGKTQRK